MLFVTGDYHGGLEKFKIEKLEDSISGIATKDDYLLICGDFGCVWGSRDEEYEIEWLNNCPWTTIFVDGNHENFDLLDTFPIEEWKGGKVHRIRENILHLMRGEVYEIDGRKILAFGGATSIDKEFRTEYRSWWRQEVPTQREFDNATFNLQKVDFSVDYVFTHCAPSEITKAINYDFKLDTVTNMLTELQKVVKYNHWYCGHYHIDRDVNEDFTVLYDEIERLW